MTDQLSVSKASLAIQGAGEALASLPLSFYIGDTQRQVVAVSGKHWLGDAHDELLKGAAGVLAVPAGVDFDLDEETTTVLAMGRPVVLADRWSHSAAVALLGEVLSGLEEADLVELRAVIPAEDDRLDAFIDLAVLADVLTGPLKSLRVVVARPSGLIAIGNDAKGRGLYLNVQRSPSGTGEAAIRAIARDRAVDARIAPSSTALPATIRMHDRDKTVQLPTIYESADRAAWRTLRDAVRDASVPADLIRRSTAVGMIRATLADQLRRWEIAFSASGTDG